jgi:phosphoribosylformimino-5-aminoimidazole carboxamide ribonucleotide (ProFAR) isomerase
VRTPGHVATLARLGASRIIVGTAAFTKQGINREFLEELAPYRDKIVIALDSKGGKIVVKGWQESLDLTAEQVIAQLEPYCSGFLCTYVDKEGMMQGTDLDWFAKLRAATSHEITAAGGITTIDDIEQLDKLGIHSALGMAIYTGRLDLGELAGLSLQTA